MSNHLDKKGINHSSLPTSEKGVHITSKEAENLANELKTQIKEGKPPNQDKDFINLLVAGLGDKRGLLRRAFSKALGEIGVKAVPALINALHNHPDVTVRRAAAKTLRIVGDPNTLPDLLRALKTDPDPVVQGSSVASMAIFGEEAVELLFQVFDDPQSTVMQSGLASWGIAFIGEKGQKAILKATLSKNAQVRAAAIAALGEQINSLSTQKAKEILYKAVYDQSPDVRSEAIILIGNINNKEWTKELLSEKMNDENIEVRKNTIFALIKTNNISYIMNLKNKLANEKNEDLYKTMQLAIKILESKKDKNIT